MNTGRIKVSFIDSISIFNHWQLDLKDYHYNFICIILLWLNACRISNHCILWNKYDNRFQTLFDSNAVSFLQAYLRTFCYFLFKSHLSSSVNNIITYTWYSLYGMIEKVKRSKVVMHEVLYNVYDQNIFFKTLFNIWLWTCCLRMMHQRIVSLFKSYAVCRMVHLVDFILTFFAILKFLFHVYIEISIQWNIDIVKNNQ